MEDQLYSVEQIMSHRMFKDEIQVLVKWLDFPNEDNTWEPLEAMLRDVKTYVD